MLIHVKVHPDSKEDRVEDKSKTSFDVYVRDSAENNNANRKMLALVARHLGIVQGKIKIITGHHHPSKILEIAI